ncbi:hypothetical protein HDU91_007108, partial [Kappamyces sp. JEL0680]
MTEERYPSPLISRLFVAHVLNMLRKGTERDPSVLAIFSGSRSSRILFEKRNLALLLDAAVDGDQLLAVLTNLIHSQSQLETAPKKNIDSILDVSWDELQQEKRMVEGYPNHLIAQKCLENLVDAYLSHGLGYRAKHLLSVFYPSRSNPIPLSVFDAAIAGLKKSPTGFALKELYGVVGAVSLQNQPALARALLLHNLVDEAESLLSAQLDG